MKAIILAAGRGSRMGHLTEVYPKCFTKYNNKPLIEYQIDALKGSSIKDIAVVQGYRKETFDSVQGIERFSNEIWSETNMVVSLLCAEQYLKSDTCIISYADILYSSTTILSLIKKEGDIVIPYNLDWLNVWKLRFEDPLSDAETFQTNGDILIEIGEKPKTIEEIKGQYMGLLKITPKGWADIRKYLDSLPQERLKKLDMTSLLKGLLKEGVKIQTIPIEGGWFEIDSESDLKVLEQNPYLYQ